MAEVRRCLEEYVTCLQVGEEQTVGITGKRSTLYLLVLGNLLEEGYIERQRTIHHHVAQLTAIGHLREQCTLGSRRNVRVERLGRSDAGNLRGLDTQGVSRGSQVADHLHLLLHVRKRNDGDIRHDQQLRVNRHLDYRNVAQRSLRGEQAGLLVQDTAHVLLGRNQTLHQHISLARSNCLYGLRYALYVALLVHDREDRNVDTVLGANLLDNGLLAVENRIYQTLIFLFKGGICQKK